METKSFDEMGDKGDKHDLTFEAQPTDFFSKKMIPHLTYNNWSELGQKSPNFDFLSKFFFLCQKSI